MPEVLLQHFDLFEEGFLHRTRDIPQGIDDGIAEFDSHPTRLDFLAAALFFSSAFMWAIISSAVSKGPYDGPVSALSSRASIMRRWAGVYSSSAFGNWERSITNLGVITIWPRRKAKFTKSPLDSPAWRGTLVGMVTWPLCWILAVVFITIRFRKSGIRTSVCRITKRCKRLGFLLRRCRLPAQRAVHLLDRFPEAAAPAGTHGLATLMRDVDMLLAGHRIHLILQHAERANHARAGLVRLYHVIHVAALGCHEGVGEALAEFLHLLPARGVGIAGGGELAAGDDVDRG